MRSTGRSAGTGVACVRAATVVLSAAVVGVGAAGPAAADDMIGRGYLWPEERFDQNVPMDDPWVFRGPVDYQVTTQPVCWMYWDRQELVAEVWVTALDRFEPFPFDPDRLFLPVRETVTVDWTNTTTGHQGRAVAQGESGTTLVGVPGGPGVIEMDIHLRSDHPWLHAVGSTELPAGHAEGVAHAAVDLDGKTCA